MNDVSLWRSFWLGCRAAMEAYGIPTKEANRESYLDVLGKIATGDQTLSSPNEMACKFSDPDTARVAFNVECKLISDDRELARRILDGMAADLQ